VPMMLGRVMPEPPDFDLHTFMCLRCEFVKCVAIEVSNASRRALGDFAERLRQSALKRPGHRTFLTTIGSSESEQY
jgi:hypothetical protein